MMTRKEFIKWSALLPTMATPLGTLLAKPTAQKEVAVSEKTVLKSLETDHTIKGTLYPNYNLDTLTFSKNGSYLIANYANKKEHHRIALKTISYQAVSYKWMDKWAGDYRLKSVLFTHLFGNNVAP